MRMRRTRRILPRVNIEGTLSESSQSMQIMQHSVSQSGASGVLVGVGAALTLVVLLVLQSLVGSGLLSTRTVTSTTTITTPLPAGYYDQIVAAYSSHLTAVGSRNVTALLSGYETNATVEWIGNAAGLGGNYTGLGNGSGGIGRLLGYFPGNMVNLTLSQESQPMVGVQGSHLVAGSTFSWYGFNSYDGDISGIVAAQDSYAHVGNTWLIASETWTWISFVCQFPGCHGP
jgi:hypothetical protein